MRGKLRGPKKPTPYKLLERLADMGLTMEEMQKGTGLSPRQFGTRMAQDKRFFEIVSNGRKQANRMVEKSLFRRALGYNIKSMEVEESFDSEGNLLNRKVKHKHHHIPADVNAALNWLYNRDPERWKKSMQIDLKNELSFTQQIELMDI